MAAQLGGSIEGNILNIEDFNRAIVLADNVRLSPDSTEVFLNHHKDIVIRICGLVW